MNKSIYYVNRSMYYFNKSKWKVNIYGCHMLENNTYPYCTNSLESNASKFENLLRRATIRARLASTVFSRESKSWSISWTWEFIEPKNPFRIFLRVVLPRMQTLTNNISQVRWSVNYTQRDLDGQHSNNTMFTEPRDSHICQSGSYYQVWYRHSQWYINFNDSIF